MSPTQYDFRKKLSLHDARCMYNAVDNKRPCLSVLIDLTKTLDMVSHRKNVVII